MEEDAREQTGQWYPTRRPQNDPSDPGGSRLDAHINDRDNPHGVTAEQIGTLTEEQIRELLKNNGALTPDEFKDVEMGTAKTTKNIYETVEALLKRLKRSSAVLLALIGFSVFGQSVTGEDGKPLYDLDQEKTVIIDAPAVKSLLERKQEALEFDSEPTQNSAKSVKSGGIWAWVQQVLEGYLTKEVAAATYQPKGDYLTAEADPTVSAWAKTATKPTYTWSEILNSPTTWAWEAITGKPSAFPPASHTHMAADVTDLGDRLNGMAYVGYEAEENPADTVWIGTGKDWSSQEETAIKVRLTEEGLFMNVLTPLHGDGRTLVDLDYVDTALSKKQDKIGASTQLSLMNLTASGTVAAAALAEGGQTLSDKYAAKAHTHAQGDVTGLTATLATKQDSLTAGEGISIEGNVISSTGGGDMEVSAYEGLFYIQGKDGAGDCQIVLEDDLLDGTVHLFSNRRHTGEWEEVTESIMNTRLVTKDYVDEAVASASGGSYTLPVASASTLGGVMVSGNESGIAIDGEGRLSIPIADGLMLDYRGLSATGEVAIDENGGLTQGDAGLALGPLQPLEENVIGWKSAAAGSRVSMLRVIPDASEWIGFNTEGWPEGAKLFVRLTTPASFELPENVKVLGYFDLEPSSTYQLEAWVVGGTLYLNPIFKE